MAGGGWIGMDRDEIVPSGSVSSEARPVMRGRQQLTI